MLTLCLSGHPASSVGLEFHRPIGSRTTMGDQMLVRDAQSEVRRVYVGGLVGQTVSGVLWLPSAALASWHSQKTAMIVLVVGGFFIYPVLSLVLRILGRPASL